TSRSFDTTIPSTIAIDACSSPTGSTTTLAAACLRGPHQPTRPPTLATNTALSYSPDRNRTAVTCVRAAVTQVLGPGSVLATQPANPRPHTSVPAESRLSQAFRGSIMTQT